MPRAKKIFLKENEVAIKNEELTKLKNSVNELYRKFTICATYTYASVVDDLNFKINMVDRVLDSQRKFPWDIKGTWK